MNSGATASRFTGYQTIGSSSNSATTNFQLTTGSVGLAGAASVNSLKLAGSGGTTSLALSGLLTNTTGGVLFDNSLGSAQITGSTLGAAGSEVIIITGGTGGSSNVLTVGSLIGSGTGSLTKSGPGTLVLTANNAYTGNTTINEGTVRLSGATATLGTISGTNVTTIRQGGTLDINAAGPSATATVGMLNGAGLVTNSGGGSNAAGTLSIGHSTTTTGTGYFTGILQDGAGRLGVTKTGSSASVQYLTGANTYTGPTTISSGTLAVTSLANIGQASGIGAGDATNADSNAASLVFNGGVLQYTGANGVVYQATQTPSVSIDRLFTLAGNGTIDSSGRYGDNDLTLGSYSPNAATLILSNTGAVRFSGAAGSRTLTLQGSVLADGRGNKSFDNQIALRLADGPSNTLALTKAGNTLWKLTNTGNSYSGDTTVSRGMLEVGDDSSAATRTLSQNSNLNLSGGILVSSGTFARSVGTGAGAVRLTSAADTGFAAGPGDLVVNLGSGTLSWGSTNFNPGTLYLNGPTSLGAVTFASPIDLNNGSRTISVIDNVNSTFDYAIVSGVISGSGGLTKTVPLANAGSPYGSVDNVQLAPALRLTGLNTFTGTVTISSGPLVVETIGNSASTASNLGAGSAVVVVGNNGRLDYIGSGETTNRQISGTANGSVEINNNGSGPLVLTNLGMTATSGVSTLTLGGFYPGANEIRSNLAPTASGTINLTLSNLSTWTLSGTNTFGTVLVGPGAVLGIGSDTALNASATLTVGAFSRFPQIAAVGGARTVANNISLGASGDNFGFTGDNSITYSGTLAITSSVNRLFLNNSITSGSLAITGPISFATAAVVNLKGPGQTVVSGSLIGSGTIRYYSADTTAGLTFAGNYGSTTLGGVMNDGPAPIIFASSSAIPGTGANVTAAAGSTLAAGYAVDQAFLNRIAAGSLTNSFAVGLAADSANNLNFSSGGRNLTNASLGAVGSTTRVYSGTLTPNGTAYRLGGGGGTLDFQGPLTGASNTLEVGGDLAGLGGTVILSNTANSYGGVTTVRRGVLRVAMVNNQGLNSPLGTSGTITLGSGTTAGTLQYSGTGGHSTNRVINLAGTSGGGGIIDASGSGTVAFLGGVTGNAGTTLTLAGSNTGGNYIQSIGGSNVVKTGPGTWVFGSNSFTGRLSIEQGTIIAALDAPGGSGTTSSLGKQNGPIPVVGLANGTGTAALLAADGVTISRVIEVASLGSGSQEVVLGGSGAGEATFDGNSAFRLGRGVTLAADPGGNVRFLTPTANWDQQDGSADPAVAITIGTPTGTGTVTLETSLPNSITAVTVRQGTLRLGNGTTVGALGPASTLTGSAGATLAFNRSDTINSGVDFAATIAGAMNVTQLGSGTVVLAGVNTYTGTTSIAAGAIRVSGSGRIADSARIDVGAAGRIVFNRSDDYGGAYDGKLAGSGFLTVQSGSLTLTGLNTFAGSSEVLSGAVLKLDGQINNTTLSVAGGATLMGSGTILGTTTIAGLHRPGSSPGIQTLGNLTYLSGASVQWELWNNTTLNTASPPDYDQILLTGNLDFSGATAFNLVFTGSAGPTNYSDVAWGNSFWDTNQEWLVYDVTGTTTGFQNLSLVPQNWADSTGVLFNTARSLASFRLERRVNNDVYLVYSAIPEPSTIALAGIGLAAAAWAARRRAQRRDRR